MAALRDAEQQSHAQPLDLLLVENVHAEPGIPSDLCRTLGEHPGSQNVRRLVAEIARDVARLAEDAAAFDGGGELAFAGGAGDYYDDVIGTLTVAVRCLIAVVAEHREEHPLGDRLCGLDDVCLAAMEKRHAGHATLPRRQAGSRGKPPKSIGREVSWLAGADQREARRSPWR